MKCSIARSTCRYLGCASWSSRTRPIPAISRRSGGSATCTFPMKATPTPKGPAMRDLEKRLQDEIGPETSIRIAPRLGQLFVHVKAGDAGYWVGFPIPPRPPDEDIPWRAATWAAIVIAVLLAAAFAFA